MILNPDTRVVVFCYAGDRHQVENLMPNYRRHGAPISVLSPEDSPVRIDGVECLHAGRRAYIGQDSLTRHRLHLKLLLDRCPEKYFFLNDPDSFCVSPELPARLYRDAEDTVWGNEVVEPRPHWSPYPKIAIQPPYFLTRETIRRLLEAPDPGCHPITPYIDWYWVALCYSAAITHRPFTLLEHPSTAVAPFIGSDPWDQLAYRIRHCGTTMMHPIKTVQQIDLCNLAFSQKDS